MESITPERSNFNDFPKWVSKGSTWINQNGLLIDLANLPPDTCKAENEWFHAIIEWYAEKAPFVSKEDIVKADLEWELKEKGCEYCKRRHFRGFSRMKNLAAERKRRASMPKHKKKLNKYTRKMYFVEADVDWDKD